MPPEALNALNVEEQAARWRDVFRGEASDDASAVFLALGEGQQPRGFGACGRQRGPRLAEAGFPSSFRRFIYRGGRSGAALGAR